MTGPADFEVWIDDTTLGGHALVGHLARRPSRTGDVISFTYSAEWLQHSTPVTPFQLDPQLPLVDGPQYATEGSDRVTPCFVDASPDRWGKLLMDRREAVEAREEGRGVRTLMSWDYLLGVSDENRMGALRLRDPATGIFADSHELAAPPQTDLRELEAAAQALERGDPLDTPLLRRWLRQLIAPGASLGGARPKAGFFDEGGVHCLAKFPSTTDRHDVGLWELLTWQMACDSGINVPPARAASFSELGHTFIVQRFDRQNGSRRMYASAHALLDARSNSNYSYLDLVELIEHAGTSATIGHELEQLFRRVMFNILVGNRDDHLRNHGFLREGNGWRLSPAFDINPNTSSREHVLAIDGTDPTPDTGLLLSMAAFYRLSPKRATQLADQTRAAVRGWEARASRMGIKGSEIALMGSVIDPDR